ncbi:MAG: aspartate aminotransferase family protein [Pseudomonadales bacterium]|jgi:acetylornithine aminotransferase|nr:aspartate aminotransferase family protein [Pseudomonadales bacterium]
MNHVMNTYGRMPVNFVSGQGSYLEDSDGKRYLDGLTGIAVCGLGHAHPHVAQAIANQANTLVHTSNLYEIPLQTALAARLCEKTGMDNVFFANSGAEANEAAIKLARMKGNNKGIKSPCIVVVDGSFHGRTMATLTATGNRKVHAGFEPLLSGFVRAPFDDIEAIEKIARNNPNVVGLFVEPILGEGGIHIPQKGYLTALRKICDQYDWLMMVDEVQTGNARTGKYFAFQHEGIMPDVLTTAKGLGNGMPIGACLARGEAASLFVPGNHGSTFGGNPLACAAAHAVIDVIEQENLEERAIALGEHIQDAFRKALDGNNNVKEIRGAGLMLAVELNEDAPDLVHRALADGVLINVTQGNIVRLLPPLTMTNAEADELVAKVAGLINP